MRIAILAALMLAQLPLTSVEARPPAIGEADRRIADRRPVAVTLSPERIVPSINIGRVAADSQGGILGFLLDNKASILSANASDRADAVLRPLVEALEGFDPRHLALATTTKALSKIWWLEPGEDALVLGNAGKDARKFVAAHPALQVALVRYGYQTSPDFTQIQLVADIALADAKTLKPVAEERVISAVQLNQRSHDHATNVARWAAEDGKLARAALAAAFLRLETVLPRVLALTPAEYERATDRKVGTPTFAAGFYGPQLMRDALGPVLWSKREGFIAVQSAED